MLGLYKILLSVSVLTLVYGTAAFAESDEQTFTREQLFAQVQVLQTQIVAANRRITALEAHNKLERQMNEKLFARSFESLHGRNR